LRGLRFLSTSKALCDAAEKNVSVTLLSRTELLNHCSLTAAVTADAAVLFKIKINGLKEGII